MILGYLTSITVSTQEGIDIFQAVNDPLVKFFLSKTIHKEQKPETNFAIKPEASIVKSNLTDIVKLREFKINGKIGTPGQKGKLSFMS